MFKKILITFASIYASAIATLLVSKRARETTAKMLTTTQKILYRAIKRTIQKCKNVMTFEEFERRTGGGGPKPLGPMAIFVKYPEEEEREVIELTC